MSIIPSQKEGRLTRSLIPDFDSMFNDDELANLDCSDVFTQGNVFGGNGAQSMSPPGPKTSSTPSMPLQKARIVSAASMSSFQSQNGMKRALTHSLGSNRRTSDNTSTTKSSRFDYASLRALVDSKKRDAVSGSSVSHEGPTLKKSKSSVGLGDDLHITCIDRELTSEQRLKRIQDILAKDPASIRRSASVQSLKRQASFNAKLQKYEVVETKVNEKFTYPVNLAISKCATIHKHGDKGSAKKLLELLIHADASIVAEQDGPRLENSLHLLLKHIPSAVELVDACILRCPHSISMADAKGNTPLHTAVQHATNERGCLESIMHLAIMYPEALYMTNFDGKTPLEIAQHRSTCPEAVVAYLYEKVM